MCYLDYFSLLKVVFHPESSVERIVKGHMTSGHPEIPPAAYCPAGGFLVCFK